MLCDQLHLRPIKQLFNHAGTVPGLNQYYAEDKRIRCLAQGHTTDSVSGESQTSATLDPKSSTQSPSHCVPPKITCI